MSVPPVFAADVSYVAPDFTKSYPTDLSGPAEQLLTWRKKTVIVKAGQGFGSGFFVSSEGHIITNYHVVEDVIRVAVEKQSTPMVSVITCEVEGARVAPAEQRLTAEVVHAVPSRDLAVLKVVDAQRRYEYFELADSIALGEQVFAIGSPGGGLPWAIRQGLVSGVYKYPSSITDGLVFEADDSSLRRVDRLYADVVLTDIPISSGDSGGPLLNAKGNLVGATFATPTNLSSGAVGYHISLGDLREVVEGAKRGEVGDFPPDLWGNVFNEHELTFARPHDLDKNGKIDLVEYIFISIDENGDPQTDGSLIAIGHQDIDHPELDEVQTIDLLPSGMWGVPVESSFTPTALILLGRSEGAYTQNLGHGDGAVINLLGDPMSAFERAERGGTWTRSMGQLQGSQELGEEDFALFQDWRSIGS